MTLDELDAARPSLNDGNYLLDALRAGETATARRELQRLTAYYRRGGFAVTNKSAWRCWCRLARVYLETAT